MRNNAFAAVSPSLGGWTTGRTFTAGLGGRAVAVAGVGGLACPESGWGASGEGRADLLGWRAPFVCFLWTAGVPVKFSFLERKLRYSEAEEKVVVVCIC
eukprot:SAG11_NODE_104_length_16539_cov_8.526642_8_plen_99_part_00